MRFISWCYWDFKSRVSYISKRLWENMWNIIIVNISNIRLYMFATKTISKHTFINTNRRNINGGS